MPIAIAEYRAEFEPAVRAFNVRLQQGGVTYRFPEASAANGAHAPVVEHGFVAVQDGRDVRGGYLIRERDYWLGGRRMRAGFIRLPLSEGLVDRTYSMLAAQLMAHALRRQPFLFGLGIGGRDQTFTRIVSALGWTIETVPFFFRVARPSRVARGLAYLRRTRSRRLLLDAAAWTGAAWLAGRAAGVLRPLRPADPGDAIECFESLDAWADGGAWLDELWQRFRVGYELIGWRDHEALALTYPDKTTGRYLRYCFRHRGTPVAWAIALDTQMAAHPYFGDLRVATLVDCFGDPHHAAGLVSSVTRHLETRGVDLVISNQSARLWGDSLRASGFHPGPSNFLFAASPRLAAELAPLDRRLPLVHFTRGDGDGPINL